MTLFLVVSEIRGGFLKFTRKRTAAKSKAARLLTYVGRPNVVVKLAAVSHTVKVRKGSVFI